MGNIYAWRPAERCDAITTRLAGGTVKVFCALGEGTVRVMPADSADSEGFLRFLKAIHKIHRKFVMILDNASYHKSGKVMEGMEKVEGVADLPASLHPAAQPRRGADGRLQEASGRKVLHLKGRPEEGDY